ncbi:MAG: TlpA disulfide reductase family protein, partial [Limnohabitans sp.]
PCVEEMPLLDRFFQQNSSKGWQIVGIAIDQPSAVRRFLAAQPVHYPIALGGLNGNHLGRQLGNETGSLPYTLVLDARGHVMQQKLGRLDAQDIQKWT